MPFTTIRKEEETKFSDLSMFNKSKLDDHIEKALCAMGSSWSLYDNDEYTSITID